MGPAITARAWSTYIVLVWLVDSLSIGILLVTADVASACALLVANLAVALADFVGGGAVSVSGICCSVCPINCLHQCSPDQEFSQMKLLDVVLKPLSFYRGIRRCISSCVVGRIGLCIV